MMLKRLRQIRSLSFENPVNTSFMRYFATASDSEPSKIDEWWPLEKIAPVFTCAVVKAEDFCFFLHGGVMWQTTLLGTLSAVGRGTPVRGASTITQQLARNLFLTPERKISRKLREMVLAVAMDNLLGKRRILEMYLNTIEWGERLWGCAAATRHYLGKTPDEVDSFEAVVLSTLLPAPRKPLAGANLDRAHVSQNRVSWQLYLSGVIDKRELADCLHRIALLRTRLMSGEPLQSALSSKPEVRDAQANLDQLIWPRQITEPLPPADAIARGCGAARERLELIELRRRFGPNFWRRVVSSGDFTTFDPK
jgi:monofunctional biosynthetic peptidoglycan transglycosylase